MCLSCFSGKDREALKAGLGAIKAESGESVREGRRLFDEAQAMAVKAFQNIVRILQKRVGTWEQLQRIWEQREHWRVTPLAKGPVQHLAYLMERWSWQWEHPFQIRRPCGRPIHLMQDSNAWVSEQVKEALRETMLQLLHDDEPGGQTAPLLHAVSNYDGPPGGKGLVEAVAEHFSEKYGWGITAEEIAGVVEAGWRVALWGMCGGPLGAREELGGERASVEGRSRVGGGPWGYHFPLPLPLWM